MSFSYQGPALLEFFHDTECVTFGARILLSQNMPDLFSLTVPYGTTGYVGAMAVRVSLPDGWVKWGVITWTGESSLVFDVGRPGMDESI